VDGIRGGGKRGGGGERRGWRGGFDRGAGEGGEWGWMNGGWGWCEKGLRADVVVAMMVCLGG